MKKREADDSFGYASVKAGYETVSGAFTDPFGW